MDTIDAAKLIEGDTRYEYLGRSIAIITILYEHGILQELLDSGRLNPTDVDVRFNMIKDKFALYAQQADDNSNSNNTGSSTTDDSSNSNGTESSTTDE